MGQPAERVELQSARKRSSGIQPTKIVMLIGIADLEVDPAGNRKVGIAGLWLIEEILNARVGRGAVGVTAIADFAAKKDVAVLSEGPAVIGVGVEQLSIMAVVERRRLFRRVFANLCGDVTWRRRLEHDVDDAGDRVRAVLCRRAIAQNLDVIDHPGRNGIEVDRLRPAPDESVDVHDGAHVPALAVHEHERLIGRQSAQRRRPHVVGRVAEGRAREVERRRECLNHLRGLRPARRSHLE